MTKKKLLLALSVLVVAAVTIVYSALAKTAVVPSKGIVVNYYFVDREFSDTAIGEATVVRSFGINEGYGHLKLHMKNYRDETVTVNLEHINSGLQYFSNTIAAGETVTWKNFDEGYPQGMRVGDYKLTWIGGSSSVNGEYWGKTASITTALQ